jgi:hypothetical protein
VSALLEREKKRAREWAARFGEKEEKDMRG